MEKNELYESIAAVVSGVTAAVCFTLLYVAMAAPVVATVETVSKAVS